MNGFSSLIKRKMGAVFLSVAFVVLSAATAQATAFYFANANALLIAEPQEFVFSGFEPGFGIGNWDGNFDVDFATGNADAFATTDFFGIPTPIGVPIPQSIPLGGNNFIGVSATALGFANNIGLAFSAAGSVGTLGFFNPNPFESVDIDFTLLLNGTIAGGADGNEEDAFALAAFGGFTRGFENDSAILTGAIDFAPPDFLETTFKKYPFGIVKKTFTKTLGEGSDGFVTIGVLAAGAAKATPEPGTIILLGTGLIGVGVWRLRKKNSEV